VRRGPDHRRVSSATAGRKEHRLRSLSIGARAFIPLALAGAALVSFISAAPVAAAAPKTEAYQLIRIAMHHRGAHYRYGAEGPRAFDCSGLVIYAFRHAGDGRAVANGHLRSARALYHWYRSRHLASRSNPRPGDLVVWGGGTHIGIYIGHGKAISALTNGVRVHGVHAVTARFTAYLHTGMSKRLAHPHR
jgi:cell wall-associated NlpC family hydrolase